MRRSGSGAPMVLIHGLGHGLRAWEPLLPGLERSFDVLAGDLPGFGNASPLLPDWAPTPQTLADHVERQMEAAGLQSAHLVGSSLGGWIAIELALRGRARTVTAISPAGLSRGFERVWEMSILSIMRLFAANAPAPSLGSLENVLTRAFYAGPAVARPWRATPSYVAESLRTFGSAPRFWSTFIEMQKQRLTGLHAVRCPLLVLWGTSDRVLLPSQARRFVAPGTNTQLRYLKHLGHTPMPDDPELLATTIADFARSHERGVNLPNVPALDSKGHSETRKEAAEP